MPSRHLVTLSFTSDVAAHAEILLYSMTGKMVFSQSMDTHKGDNQAAISIENYAAGIYFAIVKQNDKTKVAKLIKE